LPEALLLFTLLLLNRATLPVGGGSMLTWAIAGQSLGLVSSAIDASNLVSDR
jgi:hypothetical protein